MIKTPAYAASSPTSPLAPLTIDRRDPRPTDIQIDILFCGVCHSDIHTVRSEWPGTVYPCVPGHEIVGRVTAVGSSVSSFKIGDLAAVGCMVDSCGTCPSCRSHEEQFCENTITFTYNSPDPFTGKTTYGGYSKHVVVDQRFCLHVSDKLNPAAVAPLLCAGITTYSPLRHWDVTKGKKVGIVGLGGLGHMGLKFAHAFGAHTVLFTTSTNKTQDAQRLGADEVVLSKDPAAMAKHNHSFDFILDTVSATHNLDAYLALLKRDGTMCLVGLPETPPPALRPGNLLFKRRALTGSIIGGIKETQEMLDFCAAHNIVSDIEMTTIDQIESAYTRILKSDVKYRFVIDMASLKA
jgi:uncharacterized zinc-type alcohol dehydrogenase-like protein